MQSEKAQLIEKAVTEIRAFCVAHADPKVVLKYSKYFTEGYDGYGISSEVWKENRPRFCEMYKDQFTLTEFFDLGDALFASGKYEEGSWAIVFLEHFVPDLRQADVERLGGWLEKGVRNWAHTDVICGQLIAPCLKTGAVSMDVLAPWCQSEARWKRRAVPVSLLALIGKTPTGCLLDFVRPMMLDEERVVHQGLGWFLREIWKKDPAPVEGFLLEWKEQAARLIFQYATEKMTAEQKARFRRSKKGK